ncbi:hypothetical protein, partial [Acidilobus sp.]|uniref:hypothetical protein n=1 Tax=Acidilobus sp. TaxID=1872109 RepID=UPI003CFC9A7B
PPPFRTGTRSDSEYAFLYLLSPHLDPIAETRLEYPSTPLNISMDIGKYIYVGINDTVYAFSDDLTQVSHATYPGNVLRVRPINGVVHVVYESGSGSVLEMDTPELRRESTHAFTYKILDKKSDKPRPFQGRGKAFKLLSVTFVVCLLLSRLELEGILRRS